MLSIRTQDRMCLVPYDSILAIKKDYAINAWSLETVVIHNGYSIVCDAGILGIYKTKERALEVLDEIQWRIEQNEIIIKEEPTDNCYSYTPKRSNVYEMPKE